ncbi:hypothetical protein GCM10011380_13520 [Sphingomonas metalli]|uniref:J domain-containing protein n=1 Tax=Sphingomonas metalli TaxID=1779358 RepID=A0A916T0C9_9SPHN|nr:J domain-containing protein [Sphingomonas metalli]GGB25254.1 hypothetical protein GCM10011380_13520 [Sphingomonas metalli]
MKWIVAVLLIWAAWKFLRPSAKPRRPLPAEWEKAEARAVLGLSAEADEAAIRAAHRRLLAGVHPDRGGSEDLARRVNAARDLLLRGQ